MELVLRNARPRAGEPVDIGIDRGRIVHVGPRAPRGAEEVDLDGRRVLPGLWDAHVHFTQWARTRGRLDVSQAVSAAHACALVARSGTAPGVLLVGFGFRWATWDAPPSLEALDAARPGPTVLLSGDLHTSWVSTAAAAALGLPRAGLLVEDEAFDAQRALDAVPLDGEAVAAAVGAAHARGVVGVTDLELADNATVWAARVAGGIDTLRVRAGFYADLLEERVAEGAATGAPVAGTRGMITHGPLKVITDGSLNTRTAHCLDPYLVDGVPDRAGGLGLQNVPPDELTALMSRAASAGIDTAIHAIGDAAARIALDAYEASGARGTLEHAQLLACADIPRLAALGVTASLQPEHALDDRDVTDALWADRAGRAYPWRALVDAGVAVTLGSDAPVAPLDPWIAISAAVHRTRGGRDAWHPEHALSVTEAIDASTRAPIAVGAPADLVAIDRDPSALPADELRTMPVALTAVGGRIVHRA